MKLKSLIVIILSVILLGITNEAEAQKRNKYSKKRKKSSKSVSNYRGGARGFGRFKPYTYVGANINAGNYFGDLAPLTRAVSTDISFTRPGFGVFGGYKFHHSMAVRAGFNWVRLYGDDFASDPSTEQGFPRYARNLSFRNDIKEFQLGLEIYLLPNHGGAGQRLPINAYLFIGGAIFLHDPMAKVPDFDYQTGLPGEHTNGYDQNGAFNPAPQAGEWVKLRPLGTEGQNFGIVKPYKNYAFSVPIALGGQMRIPRSNFNVGIEFGFRWLFTDYIDDVSDKYVGLQAFGTDEQGTLARILSDRSSVPVSAKGTERDMSKLNIIRGQPDHDYFIYGGNGTGIDGSKRGNPNNTDQMFVTQIKLIYHITGNTRSRAKFR
jgi:hypothetical protein